MKQNQFKLSVLIFSMAFLLSSNQGQANIELVKNINEGGNSTPTFLGRDIEDKMFFSAIDATNGRQLWLSDGTSAGTNLLKIINPTGHTFITDFIEYNGKYYFEAFDGDDFELWVTDGTTSGTYIVKKINQTGSSYPYNFFLFNNKLFFVATDGINGFELWFTDGTETGTQMLKNINTTGDSYPDELIIYNGKIYFTADDGTNGYQLWVSDGTSAGTLMLKKINTAGDSYPYDYIVFNGKLYFSADDGTNGYELWVTDGTTAGTQMVKDINPTGNSYPYNFILHNDKLYFIATDGINGYELWVTDGTGAGTLMIKNINTSGSSNPQNFIEYNGKLYFSAIHNIDGRELWVTDGTTAGTQMVKNINSLGNSSPSFFYIFNDKLYFRANDGVNGAELWVTDGTEQGTYMIKDINPGNFNSNPSLFIEYNGKLYFRAQDADNGFQLWETDGTEEGTLLKTPSIFTQTNSLANHTMRIFKGSLFFRAHYTTVGSEIYRLTNFNCEPPKNLKVKLTDSSAEVSWDAAEFDFNGYRWTLYYSGDNPQTDDSIAGGYLASGVTSVEILGLESDSSYDFYILTDCGSDIFSNWTDKFSFTTFITSVKEAFYQKAYINLFPNPAQSFVNINSEKLIDEVFVSNILGRTLYHFQLNENSYQLDLTGLENGLYFIQLKIEGHYVVYKIIKE